MTKKRQQAYPNVWKPEEIVNNPCSCQPEPGGPWVPGRAQKGKTLGLFHSFIAAWNVFTGRWDAVKWEGQE